MIRGHAFTATGGISMQNRTKLEIPYGDQLVEVTLPAKNLNIIRPNQVKSQDETKILLAALDNPIDSLNFDTFLKGTQRILILVNDGTRPTPTAKVLEILYPKLEDKNLIFLVATGSHRPPTEKEYQQIFGKHLEDFRDRIFFHDSKNAEDMSYLGKTEYGTEIYVNKLCVEPNIKILIIGSVEPHYFAGWTGGRKSLFPGVAAYKTIEQNHRFALDPNAQTLALDGNPIHDDAMQALSAFGDRDIFSIQLVLDASHGDRIYAATAGDIHSSFTKAIEKAFEVFIVEIHRKADIVIAVQQFPLDINYYQSQKSVENGIRVLKKGGILILISRCWDGLGLDRYFELMPPDSSPEAVLQRSKTVPYRLGNHKAAKYAEVARWASMWAVCGVPDEHLKRAFMKPYPNIQHAIDEAVTEKGEDAKILILMNGAVTVPTLRSSEQKVK